MFERETLPDKMDLSDQEMVVVKEKVERSSLKIKGRLKVFYIFTHTGLIIVPWIFISLPQLVWGKFGQIIWIFFGILLLCNSYVVLLRGMVCKISCIVAGFLSL